MFGKRFIVDGMLGSLARWLRLLGFDTEYFSGKDKYFLAYNARKEARMVLTRDRKFVVQHPGISLLIESEDLRYQLKEVKKKLNLHFKPDLFFTRCNICNNILQPRNISDVIKVVPEYVAKTQTHFSYCNVCGRIYWQGTHWQRMLDFIKSIESNE
ncbi:MAG: Mut7-C RNAse domain-containing protein [Candidatus Ratteibacteria bacterium]